jgi:hypothetical protein
MPQGQVLPAFRIRACPRLGTRRGDPGVNVTRLAL